MSDSLPVIDARHAALLVMDLQPGLLDSLAGADDLLTCAESAIATVRAHGGQVGYVRVAFEDADYDAMPATSRMAARLASGGRALHNDSPATAVHPRIAPQPGDIVVRKTRVGAFSTTDLAEQLTERGVTTLILAGVATGGVVLSTVRDASDRDFELFVLADCCADRDPQVHEFLIDRILPRQAHVIRGDDLAKLLEAGHATRGARARPTA